MCCCTSCMPFSSKAAPSGGSTTATTSWRCSSRASRPAAVYARPLRAPAAAAASRAGRSSAALWGDAWFLSCAFITKSQANLCVCTEWDAAAYPKPAVRPALHGGHGKGAGKDPTHSLSWRSKGTPKAGWLRCTAWSTAIAQRAIATAPATAVRSNSASAGCAFVLYAC